MKKNTENKRGNITFKIKHKILKRTMTLSHNFSLFQKYQFDGFGVQRATYVCLLVE